MAHHGSPKICLKTVKLIFARLFVYLRDVLHELIAIPSVGYTSITNIDISRVVIDIMTERYRDKPTMQFMQMNCCALDFPDETFDAVIAKGTVDSILCGEGSTANMTKLCSEVSRVLKPRGVFFIVSYGVPDNRLNYLEKEDIYSWTVTVHTVPKPSVSASAIPAADESSSVHYIYVCTKGGGAAEN